MNHPLRLGSLCTGYGGLDMAAAALLDCKTVWFAEFDKAPATISAQHLPGVPNLHDITRIPWHVIAPVDVITAGYPCQPFSLAGKRGGDTDERHLWPSILEGLKALRPRHALFENVRGHLSLGFDRVLADLASIGYAATWRVVAATDVGACHKRERLFIYAQPIEYAVQPQRSHAFARAQGTELVVAEPDLFGESDLYREPLPVAGRMIGGTLYTWTPEPISRVVQQTTLPTSTATYSGNTAQNHLRKKPGRDVVTDLSILVENDLIKSGGRLPTATATDANSSGGSNDSNSTLTDAVVRTDMGRRPNLRHLPTPDAAAGERGAPQHPDKRAAGGHSISLDDVVSHLPTPAAADGSGGRVSKDDSGMRGNGVKRSITLATATAHRTDADTGTWGPYTTAIARHEAFVTGTTPPAPTRKSRNGKPQLNAPFVEWMMGLAAGHVTGGGADTSGGTQSSRERCRTSAGARRIRLDGGHP